MDTRSQSSSAGNLNHDNDTDTTCPLSLDEFDSEASGVGHLRSSEDESDPTMSAGLVASMGAELLDGYRKLVKELRPGSTPFLSARSDLLARWVGHPTGNLDLSYNVEILPRIEQACAITSGLDNACLNSFVLDALGVALRHRYAELRDIEDLHSSISVHERAAAQVPSSSSFLYLAHALEALHYAVEDREDLTVLERAMDAYRNALTYAPEDCHELDDISSGFVKGLYSLCMADAEEETAVDWRKTLRFKRRVFKKHPPEHPDHEATRIDLVHALCIYFACGDQYRVLREIVELTYPEVNQSTHHSLPEEHGESNSSYLDDHIRRINFALTQYSDLQWFRVDLLISLGLSLYKLYRFTANADFSKRSLAAFRSAAAESMTSTFIQTPYLGQVACKCYLMFSNTAHTNDVVLRRRRILELIPDNHEAYAMHCLSFVRVLLDRGPSNLVNMDHFLEECSKYLRRAYSLIAIPCVTRNFIRWRLGWVLRLRYAHLKGNLPILFEIHQLEEEASSDTCPDHCLFRVTFNAKKISEDHVDDIALLENTLEHPWCTDTDSTSFKSAVSRILAQRLLKAHRSQQGDRDHLEKSIVVLRAAVDTASPDAVCLISLACALHQLHVTTGDLQALREAITCHHRASAAAPSHSADSAVLLYQMAENSLSRYYEVTCDDEILNELLSRSQRLLDSFPTSLPVPTAIINFLNGLQLPNPTSSIVEAAVALARRVLESQCPDHDAYFDALHALARSLWASFLVTRSNADRDRAISHFRTVYSHGSSAHPQRYGILFNFMESLISRHTLDDLVEVISVARDGLTGNDLGGPRIAFLTRLGIALDHRFVMAYNQVRLACMCEAKCTCEWPDHRNDLFEAISIFREVIQLSGHAAKSTTRIRHELSLSLQHLHRIGKETDGYRYLDESIQLLRDLSKDEEVTVAPTLRASTLVELAISLIIRSIDIEAISDMHDLLVVPPQYIRLGKDDLWSTMRSPLDAAQTSPLWIEAIAHLDNALSISSVEPYVRSTVLETALQVAFVGGHDRVKTLTDVLRTALGESNPSVAFQRSWTWAQHILDRKDFLMNSGGHIHEDSIESINVVPFRQTSGEPSLHPEAFDVADFTKKVRETRLLVEQTMQEYDLALDLAYSVGMQLLPRLAYFGLDVDLRLRSLKSGSGFVGQAAEHALRKFGSTRAIEVLEQGRNIFWSRTLHLRTPLDDLPEDTSSRLRHIFQALEESGHYYGWEKGTRLRQGLVSFIGVSPNWLPTKSTDERAAYRRWLADKFDAHVTKVRQLKGFENFLQPEPYESLCQVAQEGPVVVLLEHQDMSHAIIIFTAPLPVQAVPLPNATSARLENWMARLEKIVESGKRSETLLIFQELWEDIFSPIANTLKFPNLSNELEHRSRLWFCPTGNFVFLPIHAAGRYNDMAPISVSDFVVPSYTPTLTALSNARKGHQSRDRTTDHSVLLVGYSGEDLKTIKKERNVIQERIPAMIPVTVIDPPPFQDEAQSHGDGDNGRVDTQDNPVNDIELSTEDRIIQALATASIVHLACHGYSNEDDPLWSCFDLGNGHYLTAELLTRHLNLKRAHFAFLSACATAKNTRALPDEAIHLAATMLFVGFRSVVGTMWNMDDRYAPQVAADIYSSIFQHGPDPDWHGIPFALDVLVRKLRKGGVHPLIWATYIHMGM